MSTQNAVELVSVNELEISDVEFSDYSKNPVTSVDSVTSSDLNVATTIANYTDKTQKYIVVLAEYGAYGNLINAKALTSGTLAPLGVANVQELYTPVSLDAAKVKVFIFDDLNTISPLMDAAVLN